MTLAPGPHRLEVVVAGDLCVATVDGSVTLSTRLYDRTDGRVGAFVGEGTATVLSLEIIGPSATAVPAASLDDALVSS